VATYDQIFGLRQSSTLLARLTVAVDRKAAQILAAHVQSPQPDALVGWAKRAMLETDLAQHYAYRVLRLALHLSAGFADKGDGATDAELQALVDAYVPHFASLGL
jgi:hypothetical protein